MDSSLLGPSGKIDLTPAIGFTSISQAINVLLPWAIFLGAIVALVYIVIGAFKYIVSGGNQDGTKGARSTIVNAIIGLILLGLVVVFFRLIIKLIPGLDQFFSFSNNG